MLAEAGAGGERQLRRVLGPFELIALGVGAVIGAGIFASIGTAAAGGAHHVGAGPALVVSMLITAVGCGLCALCYAEFASMVPISGSAYTYSYATLGELVAWIIGWDLIIEYAVGNVAVAVSWSSYFCELLRGLGLDVPALAATDLAAALQHARDHGRRAAPVRRARDLQPAGGGDRGPADLAAGARASSESARFNAIMVAIKLVMLLFFIVAGRVLRPAENWQPFAPNGWAGIRLGAAIIFFAYIGFDAVSTAAEECRNPQRDMPIGIIGSLLLCTVIYVATARSC